MLYILTFSTYFFNFITIPYQTRILGPEYFGKLNFSSAFVTYFQLFIDFGFILSGTEEVAQNKNSKLKLSKIYTEICTAKLILILISTAFFLPILIYYNLVNESWKAILLYYISICIFTFFPDYLYRGMENMKAITLRNILIRIFFTVMVFFLVKEPKDYLFIPFLTLLGNAVAVVLTYIHLKTKLGISFAVIKWKDVLLQIKKSSLFFYSRIASTIYNSTNTFIIGLLYGTESAALGYYSSANKLISTAKQGITPITDSLYPYMVINKDYKVIKKALLCFMPIITVGCAIIYCFSDQICIFLFGEEFLYAGCYLKLLTPLIWSSFPSMLFGFPVLSPIGLSKYVNYSNIIGAVLQVLFLIVGIFMGQFNIFYICVATCISDSITMLYRMSIYFLYRRKHDRDCCSGGNI